MKTVEIDFGGKQADAELARGVFRKMIGMRFRREGKMLFTFHERKPVIDMFFVPVQLQLVFLDSEKTVVDVTEVQPWSVYRPSKPAKYLLESTESLDVEEGDRLDFEI